MTTDRTPVDTALSTAQSAFNTYAAAVLVDRQTERAAFAAREAALLARIAELTPTVYGCSSGGTASMPATIDLLHPKILRTYSPGQRDAAPRTLRQLCSATREYDPVKLTAGDSATIAAVVAYFRALPDGEHLICPWHEPEQEMTPTAYRALWAAFLPLVPRINEGRTSMRTVSIATGLSDLTVWGDVGAEFIGGDPYASPGIVALAEFARGKGKPYVIAETGFTSSGVVGSDDDVLAKMLRDAQVWADAYAVLWYNARANSLVTYPRPKATAYWLSLTG